MTTSPLSLPDRSSLLSQALYDNAPFTTVSALACLAGVGPLTRTEAGVAFIVGGFALAHNLGLRRLA